MDTFSSTEDMVIKARKPYTITKQRERWTEDEHNRFLEALKLHGRAWQRIEVHIGTKSAVQIRSHAQKFFSKLEKEALVKGIPIGQAVDIKIPPPRPKRKPINPYPRKTSTVSSSLQVGAKDGKLITSFSSTLPAKQMLDLEKEPLSERTCGHGKLEKPKEHLEESKCSEVHTVFREAPSTSVSSSKISTPAPGSSSPIRELVPSVKDDDLDENNESSVNAGPKGKQEAVDKQAVQDNTSNIASTLGSSHASQDKMVSGEKTSKVIDPENNGHQAAQNYPRHAPVHILDWSLGLCSQMPSLDLPCRESKPHTIGAFHGHPNSYTNQTVSATAGSQDNTSKSFIHQSLPTFPFILNPVNSNQDDYPSFLHISSAFSSLIMASLLQNPAAYAAASYAASYWPCTNVEASGDTPAAGGFPARHMNPAPSMEAIAAATVTAATAWWAAHGLLPLCAPLHAGFTCTPPPPTITPWNNAAGEGLAASEEKIANTQNLPSQDEQLEQGASEVLQAQNLASKSPTLSSSDSKVSGVAELNTVLTTPGHEEKGAGVNELNDLDKAMSKKLVDRSSCGSNTPSSSEVETDALEKHEKDKDVLEMPDTNASNLAASESSSRRSRTTNFYINESWKEVSEEGRLAFQALFSRDVLPQSFSPPHDLKDKELDRNSAEEGGKQRKDEEDKKATQLDLFNSRAPVSLLCHPVVQENVLLRGHMEGEEGLLSMGLGQGKLKARRTGFKPYKRCAAEAKEGWDGNIANNQSEETCPKRIRLQREASM